MTKNRRIPLYCAIILASIGLLLTFGPVLHLLGNTPVDPHFHFYRYTFRAIGVVSLPIIGITLIYLSVFTYHRRLLAAYISSGLSLLMLLYLLGTYQHTFITGVIALLVGIYLTLVGIHRNVFTVKNNLEGIAQHLRQIAIIAFIGVTYGMVIFYSLGSRLFHTRFSVLDSFAMTVNSLTGFNGVLMHSTRLGQLFINSLEGIGLIIFVLLLGTLLRPLRLKVWDNLHEDRLKATKIITKHSRSSEDFFKLWPLDKQYFFAPNEAAFLAYKQSGHTVIILGSPVGEAAEFSTLIDSFIDYCYALGWRIAVLNVNKEGKRLYETHGLNAFFVGNEGSIDIAHFMQETRGNKHFRYVRNKAERDGLTVVEWTNLTPAQLQSLHVVSNAWLKHGNRREYTFFMGYFDRTYLAQCRIFVLLDQNQPKAYVNLIPSYFSGHQSLDHLRMAPDTSSVGMHFLLSSVISTLSQEGSKTLNIGLSPLSGVQQETGALSRTLLQVVQLFGASYYSFKGLEQFKNKFKPRWNRQFLLYSGASTGLVRIIKDIETASSYSHRGNLQIYLSTAAGIIVLTLGLYFILA